MNILKPTEIPVYDNLYSKPSQMGLPVNHRFSMVVLFSVNEIIYCGQYDFIEGIWTTLPGDDLKRVFKDKNVQYWFYPPGSIELFKNYADGAIAGKHADITSRLVEYTEK